KFGNPVVLSHKITAPDNIWQFLLASWPIEWGYLVLALPLLLALPRWSWPRTAPLWILVLPGAWFVFQVLASFHTINSALTGPTLVHFFSVVVAFFLGFCAFSKLEDARLFWTFFLGAFLFVLLLGFQQHFGGLEETRRY